MEKGIVGEDVKQRIIAFAEKKKITISAFEKFCGLGNGTVGKIGSSGPSANVISRIVSSYPELSADWLISGKEARTEAVKTPGIPLLPFGALAGYLGENNGIDAHFGQTVYFPDFSDRGADCAIRVEGDSMIPRYNNGDILAIKILKDPTFFQWGKVYCVSTTQGCIVKRLFQDKKHPDRIICHSENSTLYPDFSIAMSDVLAVAIVVGHAGVE